MNNRCGKLQLVFLGVISVITELYADTIDMSGQEPYERCGYCHEYDGNSRMPGFPSLAGQSEDYIHKQLQDFRSGKRKGTMQSIAEILSNKEIDIVARYFSEQQTTLPPIEDRTDMTLGKKIYFRGKQQPIVPACASCHGKQGEGMHVNPRLANQLPDYLYTQMINFKQAARKNDSGAVMRRISSALTEQEIASLASFLATMPIETKH